MLSLRSLAGHRCTHVLNPPRQRPEDEKLVDVCSRFRAFLKKTFSLSFLRMAHILDKDALNQDSNTPLECPTFYCGLYLFLTNNSEARCKDLRRLRPQRRGPLSKVLVKGTV